MAQPTQREDLQYGAGPRPAPDSSASEREAAEKNDRPCVKAAQKAWAYSKQFQWPSASLKGKGQPPIKGDGSGYKKTDAEKKDSIAPMGGA
jgi:hypothetical protein